MRQTPKNLAQAAGDIVEARNAQEALELMEKRRYVRHPADVPITVYPLESQKYYGNHKSLKDIGFGGLSFHSTLKTTQGEMLLISIPVVHPVFEIKGCVVWCKKLGRVFDIGVEFTEPEKVYKARMVEQVCHIEHYRKEVSEREGRDLSGEEAALEWIKKHAAEFPAL